LYKDLILAKIEET